MDYNVMAVREARNEDEFDMLAEAFDNITISDGEEEECEGEELEESSEEENENAPTEADAEKLKLARQLKASNVARRTTEDHKRHRRDVPFKIKKFACKLHELGKSFVEIQSAVFFRSHCTTLLDGNAQLLRWVKSTLGKAVTSARRRGSGAGRKPVDCELDKHLSIEMRAKHRRVTSVAIVAAAEAHAGHAVSRSWIRRWRHRHQVVRRAKTNSPEDLCTKFDSFLNYVTQVHEKHKISVVINFDEIPVSYSGKMSDPGTYDLRGTADVLIAAKEAHIKRFATLISCLGIWRNNVAQLTISPAIIFIGPTPRTPTSNPNGLLINYRETGVATSTCERATSRTSSMNCRSRELQKVKHWSFSTRQSRTSRNACCVCYECLHVAVIPQGCTQFLQAIDVMYAAACKRIIYNQCLQFHSQTIAAIFTSTPFLL